MNCITTYELFIGSNNETKELEIEKIKEITKRFYQGATIIDKNIIGIWKGQEERTAIVIVQSDVLTLKQYMHTLKQELEQEAIGFKETTTLNFY